MILFRCPACGTAHRADPQYAGGMLPCRSCGKQVPIPHQSDPACALVYKSGESEDGLPMTVEEIRLKLVSGELADTDLVWDNSTWKPLAQSFGEVKESGGLRLKRREEEAPQKDDELDAALMPLDAVQKVDLGELSEPMTETKKKRFQLVRRHEAKEPKPAAAPAAADVGAPAGSAPAPAQSQARPETPAPVAGAEPKPQKAKGRLYYIAQTVLLVVAVVCGYKYGVGPLLSHYRHKATYVIVQNHEGVEYGATFGWRRSHEDLFPQSIANFELWVGMPESQTLSLTPKVPGTAQPFKVKVPLRPGGTTLVNLKALGEYGVYDMQAVAGKKLETPELKALAAEIAANRAPESAVKVGRQIRDLVLPAFKGTKKDMLIRSSQYDFDPGMLYRLRQRLQDEEKRLKEKQAKAPKDKKDEKPKAEAKPALPKPLVVFPAARSVAFANGTSLHHPTDRERVDRSIILPTNAINLSTTRLLKVSPPRLVMTGDAKVLNLSIQMLNTTVDTDGKKFTGQWDYRATCVLEGKDANKWRWNWVFKGLADSGGKRFNLELKVDADGKESRSVKPL